LENAALRQQAAALKKENPGSKLSRFDRIFWVLLRRLWNKWKDALIFVEPETVVNWHIIILSGVHLEYMVSC
jgi:hypothetical protein